MTNPTEPELEPFERVNDIPRALRAMRLAVREALLRHKLDGDPVVVWQDGHVVWIPAEEITIPELNEIG